MSDATKPIVWEIKTHEMSREDTGFMGVEADVRVSRLYHFIAPDIASALELMKLNRPEAIVMSAVALCTLDF